MASYFKAPTTNYTSTTLNGAVNDTVTTITVNDASKFQYPGHAVINREDSGGTATPNSREVISYTGISSNDLTGVTREVDNSTARSHADGSLIEPVLTVGMWNDLRDGVATALLTDGTGLHVSTATVTGESSLTRIGVSSNASIAAIENKTLAVSSIASVTAFQGEIVAVSSIASIARLESTTIAGTTMTPATLNKGVKGQFVWTSPGALSTSQATLAGDAHMPFLRARKNLTLNAVWGGVNSAPSTSAAQFSIAHRATAGATGAALLSTQMTIDVGDLSTDDAAAAAVLSLTSLASGTLLLPSIDKPGDAGELTLVVAATERE